MFLRTAVLLCAWVAACAPESATPSSTPARANPSAEASAAQLAAAPEQPTPRCAVPHGRSERTISVGEATREYLIDVGSAAAGPAPVVFAWHGFGSTAERAHESLQPAALWADAIVVTPRGMPRTFEQFGATPRLGWQIAAGDLEDRDLAFFDAMVQELTSLGCLDATRVYTTGFSNGGFFSNVLACHRGEVLAAAAPTGGGGPFAEACGPKIAVLVTHGRADKVVPYDAATQSFTRWGAHNGCAAPQSPRSADGCTDASGCTTTTPVRMCSYDIGHRWPEGQAERVADFLRTFRRAQ